MYFNICILIVHCYFINNLIKNELIPNAEGRHENIQSYSLVIFFHIRFFFMLCTV